LNRQGAKDAKAIQSAAPAMLAGAAASPASPTLGEVEGPDN